MLETYFIYYKKLYFNYVTLVKFFDFDETSMNI